MSWKRLKISSFLKEREDKINPEDANKTGLHRLEKIDFSGKIYINDNKPTKTGMILVKKGDLVISGINVEKGAVSVYQGEQDVLATIHYSSYQFDENQIDIGYFTWFLKSKAFIDAINSQNRGGIKTELKAKKFLVLEIDLPDIDTQKEIREKLNSVSKEINEVTSITNKNEKLIDKLRQEILSDAIKGKLVPQDPKEESSETILNRLSRTHQLDKIRKKYGKYNLLGIGEEDLPFLIPQSWTWIRLFQIAEVDPRNNLADDTLVSFIPMTLISDGYVNKYSFDIKKWKEIKNGFTHFKNSDVAIAKITPCFQNKKSALFKNLKNSYGAGTTELYIVRSFEEIVPEYLFYIFKMDKFIKGGVATFKGMAGQQRVKKDYLLNYLLPLPPFNEQKRIVEKVNQLMSICDDLEKEIINGQTNSNKLIDAVLRGAFEVG